MKFLSLGSLVTLLAAVSCSTYDYVAIDSESSSAAAYRGVASEESLLTNPEQLQENAQLLTNRILHSYLYGQTLLEKFDAKLEQDPSQVLESNEYNELLAVRTLVDHYEEEVGELYLNLVKVSALSAPSSEQKHLAQGALDTIGNFLEGTTPDGQELPENLKPLVLGNLKERQAELYEQLKKFRSDKKVSKTDEAKAVFLQNMNLLRGVRRLDPKEAASYEVDQAAFRTTLEAESKKKSFSEFKKEVQMLSEEIEDYRSEIKTGRSTSSDVFFASTGSAGNITGNGFPRNTWSLTYDDGPGSKTTPQVLANLNARGMKATFFVLAKQAEALPFIIKNLTNSGMDMASHSYTHPQLTKRGANLDKEIVVSKRVIESKTGKTVKLFRLPYGAGVSNSAIRSKIAGQKMIHVFWNVDTLDWQDKNPQSIFRRSLKQMNATKNNSGVILFHDIHQQSVTASTLLMDHLKKTNAHVCTVQGVVDQINKNLSSCK